jgi:class 3 adenylate cyclase
VYKRQIHTGSLIAGVVGRQRFTYDVWGDAVNVASLMENNSEPGRINVSEQVYHHAKPYFELTSRGVLEVKNKGQLPMYFLERLKPEYAADEACLHANERFALITAPKV